MVLRIRILLQHALRQPLSDIFLFDKVAEAGESVLAAVEVVGGQGWGIEGDAALAVGGSPMMPVWDRWESIAYV